MLTMSTFDKPAEILGFQPKMLKMLKKSQGDHYEPFLTGSRCHSQGPSGTPCCFRRSTPNSSAARRTVAHERPVFLTRSSISRCNTGPFDNIAISHSFAVRGNIDRTRLPHHP
jgi:hypothetical protein